MNKKDRNEIISILYELYGGKKIELDYETPFQLLIAVMLSAQTTDKQVNRITPPLFAHIREPRDTVQLSLEEIEGYVRYVNFYHNKARYIKETGMILANVYDGIIPNDIHLLRKMPGIGVKTAKVVLSVLYGTPHVGVDTHIHRVMNRLGIVHTNTPEETDREIDRLFSDDQKRIMHHPTVLFGRYHCTARAPKCSTCRLKNWCKYYRLNCI